MQDHLGLGVVLPSHESHVDTPAAVLRGWAGVDELTGLLIMSQEEARR